MTIDDAYVSSREAVRRQAADDERERWMDYLEEREREAVATEEARHQNRMRQAAKERDEVWYDDSRRGIDRRAFSVAGDMHRRDVAS